MSVEIVYNLISDVQVKMVVKIAVDLKDNFIKV